ncbi:MAG TPA: hypothetical protein VGU44_03875, partial [Gammaproteobacteria bacterium]|nr:hypothetical protein [Gammaproteobacteria bacterium]
SIGKIMDLFWTGTLSDNNLRIYALEVYQYALCIIPICAVVGSLIVCVMAKKRELALSIA